MSIRGPAELCEGVLIASQPWKRVHCPGCDALATLQAENAELRTELESHANQEVSWKMQTDALRERLEAAERERDRWVEHTQRADLALRERLREASNSFAMQTEGMRRQIESLIGLLGDKAALEPRPPIYLNKEAADVFNAVKAQDAAEARATAAEGERDRLRERETEMRRLLERGCFPKYRTLDTHCPSCGDPIGRCDRDPPGLCIGKEYRAYLAAHPIPQDSAPDNATRTNRQGDE